MNLDIFVLLSRLADHQIRLQAPNQALGVIDQIDSILEAVIVASGATEEQRSTFMNGFYAQGTLDGVRALPGGDAIANTTDWLLGQVYAASSGLGS